MARVREIGKNPPEMVSQVEGKTRGNVHRRVERKKEKHGGSGSCPETSGLSCYQQCISGKRPLPENDGSKPLYNFDTGGACQCADIGLFDHFIYIGAARTQKFLKKIHPGIEEFSMHYIVKQLADVLKDIS